MYADRFNAPRRPSVANIITALIAAWFVLGIGSIAAEAAEPVQSPKANRAVPAVTLTADGRMKVTVVARKAESGSRQAAGGERRAKG